MGPTLDTFIGVKPSTTIIVMDGEPTAAASTQSRREIPAIQYCGRITELTATLAHLGRTETLPSGSRSSRLARQTAVHLAELYSNDPDTCVVLRYAVRLLTSFL